MKEIRPEQHGTTTGYGYGCRCDACRAAASARRRDHRERNREQENARRRARYEENREKVLEYQRAYREENREKVLEYQRARQRAYYEENREEETARNRVAAHLRRARERGAPGTHTAADVIAQVERQKHRCFYCPAKLRGEYHVEHVTPLAPRPGEPAGSNGPENLVIACAECNRRKHNMSPMDFAGIMF